MAQGNVHIGTSGWTYDHWLGRFYPAEARGESRLTQYARSFRSVEINASFYRMPTPRAMAAWLAETPPGFVFTAKVSRFISHMKRLRDPEVHIPIFFGRIAALAPKLGATLVQLPPNFRADLAAPSGLLRPPAARPARLRAAPRELVDGRDLRLPARPQPRLLPLSPGGARDAPGHHGRLRLCPPARAGRRLSGLL